MRQKLMSAGILVSALTLGIWVTNGSHRGWTATSETRFEKDPVTEIEAPVQVKRFKPGIDFLIAGELISGGLIIASVLMRKK